MATDTQGRSKSVAGRVGRQLASLAQHRRVSGSLLRTARYAWGQARILSERTYAIWRSGKAAQDLAHAVTADATSRTEPPLLALRITGGIGDYIVIARFLRDLAAAVEPFRFDVYCTSPAAARFALAPLAGLPGGGGLNRIYGVHTFPHLHRLYPAALCLHQAAELTRMDTASELLAAAPRLRAACEAIRRREALLKPLIAAHPLRDNELAERIAADGHRRDDFQQAMAGIPYGGPAYPLPAAEGAALKLGLPQRYVSISNSFDPSFVITGEWATKCYPHFSRLVHVFKERFPDCAVVQIGAKGAVPIAGVDLDLTGRTTLPEATAVLADARLHIDNEGGLVHMAACLGTTSAVIFGPTSLAFFAYPSNINLGPPVCGNCWWTTSTWMDVCPRGETRPSCMFEHRPEAIVAAIADRWGEQLRAP